LIKVNLAGVRGFVSPEDIKNISPQVLDAHNSLHGGSGPGADMLGWLERPQSFDKNELSSILDVATEIRDESEALVVIGIGGSYLGARAAIDMLGNSFNKQQTEIYYAGHTLSSTYHADLLDLLADKNFSVNVISKSGTTTEPAIAFRLFRELLVKKYGQAGAKHRIYATTDQSKGALRQLAQEEGYRTFVIPENIGGRYSVLSPVGLLPMAVAGLDIQAVMDGAAQAMTQLSDPNMDSNQCNLYAALRNILYNKGRQVELLVSYEPALQTFGEWWKQLFGESEGKDGKGLFPASATFSTDLHSLGQYIQDGQEIIFETVLRVENPRRPLKIPKEVQNLDGLNYLADTEIHDVNDKAFYGTLLAHCDGGVPNIILELPWLDEHNLGYLVYFMEKACAISGYLLGVNPFDQPGVEAYKANMFALLGKPGYEQQKQLLEQRLVTSGEDNE
jgi:glucose-6-phosphate isomerase